MAEKTRPVVEIELGGAKRHLKLDMNAMVAFEEATGKSILKGLDLTNMGVKELRTLIWACLLQEDENLTQKDVGSWIDLTNMAEVEERFIEAFSAAVPEAKKEADPLAPPSQ